MDHYKELIWFWYIFENRTLQDTHTLLSSMIDYDGSQHILHEGNPHCRKSPDCVELQITLNELEIDLAVEELVLPSGPFL